MGFGIWNWNENGIWDWNGIITNEMGFGTNGNWDFPIPINMGGKYIPK